MGDGPDLVGEGPDLVGDGPDLVGEGPDLVGDGPDLVGDGAKNSREGPKAVPASFWAAVLASGPAPTTGEVRHFQGAQDRGCQGGVAARQGHACWLS